jgi:hypothetical protein
MFASLTKERDKNELTDIKKSDSGNLFWHPAYMEEYRGGNFAIEADFFRNQYRRVAQARSTSGTLQPCREGWRKG